MTIDSRIVGIVAAQPYPLLFSTISVSGTHLYGLLWPDSDYDLRGVLVFPLDAVVGLEVQDETVEDSRIIDGLEMDIVSRDVWKFFGLLLKKKSYVREQLYSPLIVHTTPEHAELKEIFPTSTAGSETGTPGGNVITKHHSHQMLNSLRFETEYER